MGRSASCAGKDYEPGPKCCRLTKDEVSSMQLRRTGLLLPWLRRFWRWWWDARINRPSRKVDLWRC